MRRLNGKIKIRRKRSKPFKQRNYSTSNIITTIGIVAMAGFVILAIVLECSDKY
ncbi:hypothetical protein EV195_103242 [Tenacibaculum skagerrakense]|uniref:Uncharacterized protein n=1 Tax=Tenacibaculum skagerrakense TaxID=186571 RepID=A0A4R2NV55_9FLAO|nr:hypothetical protein [Tenacibaculum skagerrakense]TCP25880.1 hypothetical protein EV195_103242 [Tenacibaculum skagerrakense]